MKISFVELENYYPIKIAKWLENAFRRFESVCRPEMMREQSSARKCIYKISKNFITKMLFAPAKSYLTSSLFTITYYLAKILLGRI